MKSQRPTTDPRRPIRKGLFLGAAALQIGCAVIFLADVLGEWRQSSLHVGAEMFGVIALLIGAVVALREFDQVERRARRMQRELLLASGAFKEVIEDHFERWGLTHAERDVALMAIKGVPITDIAGMRKTREGTIKEQNAAIYRKAGVSGRSELISVMVEELIGGLSLARPPEDAPVVGLRTAF